MDRHPPYPGEYLMRHNGLIDYREIGHDHERGVSFGQVVPLPPRHAGPIASVEEVRATGSGYCDQPMSWRTRLFGIAGTASICGLVLAAALFTWTTVDRPVVSTSQPVVVELRPLAAPPEPVRDVALGPEQVEKREAKTEPERETPPPPLIQLPVPSSTSTEVQKPLEIIDPGPAVPETTALKSVAAPAAARLSNDARQSWEAQLLAHLEQYRRFPARARAARQQGTVYIGFRMNRAGSVLSASVLRGSGFMTLDQAALDTLKRAQPLPTIPEDRPDEIELTIPVEFYFGR